MERVVDGARRDVVVRLVEWVEAGSVAELSKRVDLRVSVPLGGAFIISTKHIACLCRWSRCTKSQLGAY